MKNEFYYPSKDGLTRIHAIEWKPKQEVKAVLQICHGMVEHINRYNDFAEFLAQNGYYVVGHDHLGHGKSVTSSEKRGFFHEKNGNEIVIADIHQLRVYTERKYPHVPYFIMGHSMGSFLVRQYLGLYGEGIAGAVIMGTGHQSNITLNAGKVVCRLIAACKGWEYRSKLVNNMAAGGYEKQFQSATDGSSWLSRNPESVRKYKNDPLCSFIFTVNAYYNLFCGMVRMNRQENAGKIPMTLPVLFVAGKEDPVGNSGKGVEKVCQAYRNRGMNHVEIKMYAGARHEILNEYGKEQAYEDILNWLEKRICK